MSFNRPLDNENFSAAEPNSDAEIDSYLGRRVGIYRLEKRIGKGGMGAVYLASRDDGEFHQQVAVKLIKRGMDTDFVLNRFRHERQILASLEHPFIARLLDGGTSEDGLPYFVMDFIKGEPLVEFAEKSRLDLRGRLELFRRVCEAVEFAHQKKIVHRDLKPSNILVTANGTPKLLDFGIAKLLNPEEADETVMPTQTQMRLMTAEYAAPEQIHGEPITPMTDVYSLGVLLYELITGARPYKFPSRAPHEIARVICEDGPSSLVISRLLKNQIPPDNVKDREQKTNNDLENIVLKSLQKNPSDRYISVKEFAADIERFLTGKAVTAKPPAAKLKPVSQPSFSDNTPTGSRSIAVLPLKFFGAGDDPDTDDRFLSLGLADALIAKLSSVRRFILRPTSSVLRYGEAGADSFAAGEDLGVEFIVDGHIQKAGETIRVSIQLLNVSERMTVWAERFDEKFADVLELEDRISKRVAESLIPRLTTDEREHLERRGTNSPAAYKAYLRGRFHWNQFTPESLAKAIESFETAIRLDPDYALAHVGIADFYAWANIYGLIPSAAALDEAERAARRAIEIDERLGEAYTSLGLVIQNRRRWAEAEKIKRQALKLNPNYSHAHETWGAQLVGLGVTDEGVKEMRIAESLDPLSLRTKTLVAWTIYQAHQYDDALAIARQIIELDKNYPQGYSQAGFALWAMGRYEEALPNFRKFDEMIPNFALAKYQLCFGLAAVNRQTEARAVLSEMKLLAERGHVKPYFLAMAHTALGELDEAFVYFEQSFAESEPWMLWFGTDPMIDALRGDERYFDLLRRMNNPIGNNQRKSKQPDTSSEKSIAVLPLKIFGANTLDDDEYLSIGLADALITRLSNVRRFVVRPTSSVLQFSGDDTDSFDAGRKLGVDYVVEGNIRRGGDRIRISIQLLSVRDNSARWAEKFDELFTDVLELEDSISVRVVRSLVPQLSGEEEQLLSKRGTNNSEAYEAYLRGRFYWSLQSEESFAKAITFFERAVELDPTYALAYTAIAEYYIFLGIHCVVPFTEKARDAKDSVGKAVSLDPSLAAARAILGFIEVCYNRDWTTAEKHLRHALRLNPNSITAHNWLSTVLLQTGRFDEAVGETDCIIEIDPNSIVSLHLKAWTLYHSRRFEESIEYHQKLLKNAPNYAWGLQSYSWALRRVGRFAEAVAPAELSVQLTGKNPFYLPHLASAYADAGMRDRAEDVLAQLEEISKTRFVSEYMLALAYCALGDKDRVFENLEKSFAARDGWLNWLAIDPQFDVLRGDNRYQDLLRRMNHPLAKSKATGDTEATTKNEKSIAVLPLKIFGANTLDDDEYLSIGLADALITRLSNVRRFVVRPTSSVLQFSGDDTDSFDAGRKLGVDYVVEGNIRRGGDRIRISIQLLSVRDNSARWAEKFDELFTDVLELEDSISVRVAKSLLPQLTGEEAKQISKRGTNNSEAYEAYLRGRFNWNLHTEAGFAKAIGFYNRAIELDPTYALAHTAIAEYYIFLGIHCVIPFAAGSKAALDAAETAICLDPTLAEGYAVRGFVAISYDFDWKTAEEYVVRAIALNPNSLAAHSWYNTILLHSGRFDEAMREIDRVLELDPDSLLGLHFRAWAFYHSRRYVESIRVHQQILASDPNYAWGLQTYSWVLRRVGRFDEAVAQARTAVELTGENPFYLMALAAAYANAGMQSEAKAILARLEEISKTRFVSEYMLALVYCALNDKEKAFENLEKAFVARDGWIVWIGVEPQFDLLRDDARFDELFRRVNHPLAK